MRSILGLERGKKRKVMQNVVLPSVHVFLSFAVFRWALICSGNVLRYENNLRLFLGKSVIEVYMFL